MPNTEWAAILKWLEAEKALTQQNMINAQGSKLGKKFAREYKFLLYLIARVKSDNKVQP
jgi:hypothetical protein